MDYGFSTFAFAIPNIGKIYGIDWFKGDNQTGNRNCYEFVMKKVDTLRKKYNIDNITIIKGDFTEVAKSWNKEIDILHIDGFHSYKAVKKDYKNWSKFVKDNGVILFHDVEVMKKGFGANKLFDKIKLPKTKFKHSNGLGIVSKNSDLIDKINSLYKTQI